jgi:hypothetical protein
MPAQKPPEMSGDSDTRGSDHRARPKFQVMTIPDSIRPDTLCPPGWWVQGVTDRVAGVPAPVSLSSVGRSRPTAGVRTGRPRWRPDGTRTHGVIGDSDMSNTCRLRPMKQIPDGTDDRAPGPTGRGQPKMSLRAGAILLPKEATRTATTWQPQTCTATKAPGRPTNINSSFGKARDTSSILCQRSRSRNPHRYLLLLRNFQLVFSNLHRYTRFAIPRHRPCGPLMYP